MMQALVRGKLAQLKRARESELAEMDGVYSLATSKAQALIRRFLTRSWYLRTRAQMKEDRLKLRLAQEAQRVVRGGLGRKRARARRMDHAARVAQRIVRGRLGGWVDGFAFGTAPHRTAPHRTAPHRNPVLCVVLPLVSLALCCPVHSLAGWLAGWLVGATSIQPLALLLFLSGRLIEDGLGEQVG